MQNCSIVTNYKRVAVNYPKEYDFTSLENRLDILVNKTEGKYITKPDEVFTNISGVSYGVGKYLQEKYWQIWKKGGRIIVEDELVYICNE